jgi:hypothetical protein
MVQGMGFCIQARLVIDNGNYALVVSIQANENLLQLHRQDHCSCRSRPHPGHQLGERSTLLGWSPLAVRHGLDSRLGF